jgi:hypothetical protein
MRQTLRILCLLGAGLLTAPPARGQEQPKATPEQELQQFWPKYSDALQRFYQGVEAAKAADRISKPAPSPVQPPAPCNH